LSGLVSTASSDPSSSAANWAGEDATVASTTSSPALSSRPVRRATRSSTDGVNVPNWIGSGTTPA
jgi:hypothetical protein